MAKNIFLGKTDEELRAIHTEYQKWLENGVIDNSSTHLREARDSYLAMYPDGYAVIIMENQFLRECAKRFAENHMIEIRTSAGWLRGYQNEAPENPGISVLLQPDGSDEEIDIAQVYVYEDRSFPKVSTETPGDIVAMIYGDPYTEDYTDTRILETTEIRKALSI